MQHPAVVTRRRKKASGPRHGHDAVRQVVAAELTPASLRTQADSILGLVRALVEHTHRSGRLPEGRIEALVHRIGAFDDDVRRTARRHHDPRDLPAIVEARRLISDAQLVLVGLLADPGLLQRERA